MGELCSKQLKNMEEVPNTLVSIVKTERNQGIEGVV